MSFIPFGIELFVATMYGAVLGSLLYAVWFAPFLFGRRMKYLRLKHSDSILPKSPFARSTRVLGRFFLFFVWTYFLIQIHHNMIVLNIYPALWIGLMLAISFVVIPFLVEHLTYTSRISEGRILHVSIFVLISIFLSVLAFLMSNVIFRI